jgi:hypothetical protein
VFDDAGSNRGAIIISRMRNGISHSVPAFRRGRRKDGVGFYAVRSGPAIEFARSLRLLHFRDPSSKASSAPDPDCDTWPERPVPDRSFARRAQRID